jgi:alkylation response protein AidB-like acyl-CoA dehydrogenase
VDFELSDFEVELASQVALLAGARLPLAATRAAEGALDVVDADAWQALIEVGLFSLLVPEAAGGLGLGLGAAAVVMEELGRVLAPGPLVATIALSPHVDAAARGVAHSLLAPPPFGGVAPLLLEHPATAVAVAILPPVADVAAPVRLVTTDELAGELVADPLDPLTPLRSIAGELPAGSDLDGVTGHALRQAAMVLSSAFQVGIAREVVALSTTYATGREQFGRPIGSFQAIKHLLADAACRTEVAQAAVHAAAVTLDDPHVAAAEGETLGLSAVEVRWRAVAGAKLLADEAALANAKTAIQVHGGMGFTWEVPIHLYLKRARVLAASLATRAELGDMLAALL